MDNSIQRNPYLKMRNSLTGHMECPCYEWCMFCMMNLTYEETQQSMRASELVMSVARIDRYGVNHYFTCQRCSQKFLVCWRVLPKPSHEAPGK